MCRISRLFLLQRLKGSMSGDARDFNNIETRAVIKFFLLQGKAPKEIQAILTETLREHVLPYFPPLGAIGPYWAFVHSSLTRIFVVSWSHTTTHHNRYDSSERVIRSSQRPLPDNTQHSQQTNIHAPVDIRMRDLSRRGAVDLSLRMRSH